MAYNNNGNNNNGGNNNNNNRQRRDNYIKQQIKRSGPNIWEGKNPRDLQVGAKRIFSDIAFGNFDAATEGMYLCDPSFVANALNLIRNKALYHNTILMGVKMLANEFQKVGPLDTNVASVLCQCEGNAAAWNIISARMNDLCVTPDYAGVITCLMNQLRPYKNNIN